MQLNIIFRVCPLSRRVSHVDPFVQKRINCGAQLMRQKKVPAGKETFFSQQGWIKLFFWILINIKDPEKSLNRSKSRKSRKPGKAPKSLKSRLTKKTLFFFTFISFVAEEATFAFSPTIREDRSGYFLRDLRAI